VDDMNIVGVVEFSLCPKVRGLCACVACGVMLCLRISCSFLLLGTCHSFSWPFEN
jgi:hypothetical protein